MKSDTFLRSQKKDVSMKKRVYGHPSSTPRTHEGTVANISIQTFKMAKKNVMLCHAIK